MFWNCCAARCAAIVAGSRVFFGSLESAGVLPATLMIKIGDNFELGLSFGSVGGFRGSGDPENLPPCRFIARASLPCTHLLVLYAVRDAINLA